MVSQLSRAAFVACATTFTSNLQHTLRSCPPQPTTTSRHNTHNTNAKEKEQHNKTRNLDATERKKHATDQQKKSPISTNGTRSIGRFPRCNGTAKKKPFWSVPFPLDVFLEASGTEMGLPVRYVKCSIPLQSRPISKEPPPLHRTEPHFQKIVKSSSRIQVSGSGGG